MVKNGERRLVDEVRSGSSYISQNDMRVHFGLGVRSKIDSVQVRWPSGLLEHFDNLSADTIHTLKEGSGKMVGTAPKKTSRQQVAGPLRSYFTAPEVSFPRIA